MWFSCKKATAMETWDAIWSRMRTGNGRFALPCNMSNLGDELNEYRKEIKQAPVGHVLHYNGEFDLWFKHVWEPVHLDNVITLMGTNK